MATPETTLATLPDSLLPGLKVRLLAMETTKSKWDTFFIGSKPKRYIILEQPKVNGLPVKFDDNSKWSINFINNGQIFNFLSEVIGSCSRPVPLVFLSYPDYVETANLRHNKRYPVRIPMTAQGDPSEEGEATPLTKGLILDISLGGCLAATTGDLPTERPLDVSLYLNGDSATGYKMEKKSGRKVMGTFYSGLSFLPTNSPEALNKIAEIIGDIENIPLRI